MNPNLQGRVGADPAADSTGRYWEPWLSMWRTGALLLVDPWDNALRAFAARAQLLPRRMAALGLDREELAPSTAREVVERCTTCESPEQCEWDLVQNPTNPAWQAYCPNAATLMALARRPGCQAAETAREASQAV